MSDTKNLLYSTPSGAEAPFIPAPLLEHLQSLLSQDKRVLLGITGAPGAGKSTLSNALMAIPEITAQVLPMDGFHLSNHLLQQLQRRQRKGAADTFDADGYVALLHRVHASYRRYPLYAPAFDRELDEAIAGAIAIAPETQLVITEGNYLLLDHFGFEGVAPLLNECWYVDIHDDVRRQRLQVRHQHFGMTEEAARAWICHTDEPNAQQIKSTRRKADQIINLPPSV